MKTIFLFLFGVGGAGGGGVGRGLELSPSDGRNTSPSCWPGGDILRVGYPCMGLAYICW